MIDHVAMLKDRIAKAEGKLLRYQKSLESAESELSDLQIALRVIEGLSGAPDSNTQGTSTTLGRQREIVRLMGVGRENARPPAEIFAEYRKAASEDITIDTFRTTIWRMRDKSFVVNLTPYSVRNEDGEYWVERPRDIGEMSFPDEVEPPNGDDPVDGSKTDSSTLAEEAPEW